MESNFNFWYSFIHHLISFNIVIKLIDRFKTKCYLFLNVKRLFIPGLFNFKCRIISFNIVWSFHIVSLR